MRMLKKLIYGLLGLFVIFLVIGLMLPTQYEVQRSIIIDAEPEAIYPNVVNLRAWPQWGVWFIRDPNMQITYSGPDRAIGMQSTWLSEVQGNGEVEIVQLEHNKRVVYQLRFVKKNIGSTGQVTLELKPEGTRVTWTDSGKVSDNPMDRYAALMMDDILGPDIEMGLENLKTVVENSG
ncbi:SRPBCC family protein [Alteromonas pelagimontana]|uniref:SRPBCC family protein n=1 Tax=Alteromonas pelagimontana TaxID=1858656 RepID=A0A6M4M8H5_9ALTE|nr:SRPBCC family protein [Alteromonas pelagimontana]QJR79492.1 SRPBCC family protein [Alteromonas pelagimontana]